MTALNLLVLRARDPERLARFYEAFGLTFYAERHAKGPVHQTCNVDGAVLEIYPLREGDSPTTGTRLGFCVPSLAEALDACNRDARLLSAPTKSQWGYRAVLEDPEGHKIELTQQD
jgi:predicted enzyme related to lactoylglutathione lyase